MCNRTTYAKASVIAASLLASALLATGTGVNSAWAGPESLHRKFAQTQVLLCYFGGQPYSLGQRQCVGGRMSECKVTPGQNNAQWVDVGRC
jgi:hypothetical protein